MAQAPVWAHATFRHMLTTDRFLMLNFPKTGSSFARKAILQASGRGPVGSWMERKNLLRKIARELRTTDPPFAFTALHGQFIGKYKQHGTYHQIPPMHRHKAVMSVMRDPVERIISLYEFGAWHQEPTPGPEQIKAWFPSFPDLSFDEFFRFHTVEGLPYRQPEGLQVRIGGLTTQFIRFFARDPLKTILALREDTDLKADYDLHFPPIRFLHTEHLRQELYDYLLEMGYPHRRIAFIKGMEKVNTSRRTRQDYFTAEQVAQVHYLERFFYQLFPEYL